VHVHNFWFALSPSVFAAAHDLGTPTIAAVHNFRLLCPAGVLLNRFEQACDACIGRSPWPGVWRRCYRKSLAASYLVGRMIRLNRCRRTWWRDVDLFIVPSRFCRDTLVRGGLPAEKITVKPHFVADPRQPGAKASPRSTRSEDSHRRARALFVGRLSPEKGLRTLLAAWKRVEATREAELRIVGDGPLRAELEKATAGHHISFTGSLPPDAVIAEMQEAALLVLPSQCYETFGRVVVEAYACGMPAVVSRIGGPQELVAPGETGLLFDPGDAADLAGKLQTLLSDGDLRKRMGRAARERYTETYTPEINYRQLLACYERAGCECAPTSSRRVNDRAVPK
jgi:glycosyltransferase involved in cell wall biosynthesis